jgi:hypothetical protein
MQRRHDPKSVLSAVVKHSPGMVDQARQDKARELISKWTAKDISLTKRNKQEGPSR